MKQNSRGFIKEALKITFNLNKLFGILVILTVALGALVSVWPSLILRGIIDGPLQNGDGDLFVLAMLYLGTILLIGVINLIREYSATVFGQKMLLNIRQQMLDRLQRLPMSYFNNTPAGETISRFTADIDSINSLFTAGLVTIAADLFKIIGLLLALFMLSPPLVVIALLSIPLLLIITDYFRRNIYQWQLVVRRKVSDINTRIHEIFSGLKIIKVYGQETTIAENFEPLLESHRIAMNANSIYDAWYPCVTQTLRAIVIASALIIGAKNNLTPIALGLSIGTLAASADLLIRLFQPIEAVSGEIQTIQRALAGINRVEVFFAEETEKGKTEISISELPEKIDVKVVDVCFSYNGGPQVLRETTLLISAGTKAAIAGRTGSGKTTLMNLIAGLYPTLKGNISIGGLNPYLLSPDSRRKLIGIVPQTVHVFNGSIYENVTLRDERITYGKVKEVLEIVGLWEAVKQLPKGLDTQLGESAQQLSFGQTQLLSLARAIVTDPPLLLLDELTSGLDALTERKVLDAIRNVSENRTIITISHRLSGIIDADIVHIMEEGKIMESGQPEILEKKKGWYSIYKRLEDRGWRIT